MDGWRKVVWYGTGDDGRVGGSSFNCGLNAFSTRTLTVTINKNMGGVVVSFTVKFIPFLN